MNYKKHRERLVRARKSLTRPHLSFTPSDAAELLDKAEKWDKAGKLKMNYVAAGSGKTHAMFQEMVAQRDKAAERAEKFKKVIQRTVTFWRKLDGGKRAGEFDLFMINLLSGLEDPALVEEGKG